MSRKVIENKENISFFEKNLKKIIAFSFICCFIAGNIDELYKDRPLTGKEFHFTDLFDLRILIDMQRELIMLFGSLGLYYGARRINDWLDSEEEAEKERLEQERLKEEEADDQDDLADDNDTTTNPEPKKTR